MDARTLVAALDETWSATGSVARGLSESQWSLPTDCPGWTVHDQVAHIAALEGLLLGAPYPADHVLPEGLTYLRNDAGRFMEPPVDVRRSWSPAEVLAEFEDVTARRLAVLASLTDDRLDEEVRGFMGNLVPLRRQLPIRVFDSYAHEQDVRRAVGVPGNLTGVAAAVSLNRICEGIETPVDLVVDDVSYPVGSAPSIRLVMDFETLLRLACGRVAYESLPPGSVRIEGDVAAGEVLVRDLAMTP